MLEQITQYPHVAVLTVPAPEDGKDPHDELRRYEAPDRFEVLDSGPTTWPETNRLTVKGFALAKADSFQLLVVSYRATLVVRPTDGTIGLFLNQDNAAGLSDGMEHLRDEIANGRCRFLDEETDEEAEARETRLDYVVRCVAGVLEAYEEAVAATGDPALSRAE